MTAVPALQLRGIVKRFGAMLALDGATLTVRAGTIHALLGENGAGKSTLMRVAFGMLPPNAGTITVQGTSRQWRSSRDAIAAGLGMVHQHFQLVPAMTVAENVALGDPGFFGGFDPARASERVRAVGARTGLGLDPAARVADLPVGAQQRLEIVKALARDARVLILDEPTAVLSPTEVEELYRWLRGFVDGGGTVVLITHKVREALVLADDVTVLRRGRTVLEGVARAVDAGEVIGAMLGTAPGGASEHAPARVPSRESEGAAPVLALHGVTVTDRAGVVRLRDANVEVHGGEIVGIAGIEGAGQWELVRVLAGRLAPTIGTMSGPASTGFVPEDRLRDAVVPSFSLSENLFLRDAGSARGTLDRPALAGRTAAVVTTFDVRTPAPDAPITALSGGNQQKFVLGRELAGAVSALVAENPTRGLDIRATEQVHDRLRAARDAGAAIVVYSSDLDEVLLLADRMLVCYAGRVTEVAPDAAAVGRALVGGP